MNKSTFKYIVSVVLCLSSLQVFAQTDSRYAKRMEKYQTVWSNLIPKYGKIQYAGMMGLVSIGTGWDYGRNKQWETDFYIGFLPKYSSSNFKVTTTIKQNFIPWKINLAPPLYVEPLSCGLYMNSIFDEEFWTDQPSKYPSGYYSVSTKIRFNAYVGQRITFKVPEEKRFFAKRFTLYYELAVNDIYLLNKLGNRHLKFVDYVSLSFGLKVQWL